MSLEDIQNHTKTINIDDQTYTLQFDYAAYALLEELCSKSVYQLRDEFFEEKISIKEQLIIMYCGLLRHHKDFDICILKDHKHIGYILNKNAKGLLESFFQPLLPPDFSKNLNSKED